MTWQHTKLPIHRDLMPQVDEADYPALFTWARERDVKVTKLQLHPGIVRPCQAVDQQLVRVMPQAVARKPILTSVEPFILDGHHRWAEHIKTGQLIHAVRFHLRWQDAIAFLFTFPRTYSYGDGKYHAVTN